VRRRAAALVVPASVLAAVLTLPASLAGADSFDPVTVSLTSTAVARLHAKYRVKAAITADPGVLDIAEQPVRIGVKLASECGADYEHTTGPAVLNQPLKPQPSVGRAYSGTLTGWGRPAAYGDQALCMFIEDRIGRVYASDQSDQVNVSRPCTAAASRYDRAARSLGRAQRRLRRTRSEAARRRLRRTVARRRRTLAGDRRHGVAACGRGVAL
jgi:hypothetical protein